MIGVRSRKSQLGMIGDRLRSSISQRDFQLLTGKLDAAYREAASLSDSAKGEVKRLESATPRDERQVTEAKEVAETAAELVQRIAALYGNTVRVSEPPTTDQRAQMRYFPTVLRTLQVRWRALGTRS